VTYTKWNVSYTDCTVRKMLPTGNNVTSPAGGTDTVVQLRQPQAFADPYVRTYQNVLSCN